jgi:hypothetical protein
MNILSHLTSNNVLKGVATVACFAVAGSAMAVISSVACAHLGIATAAVVSFKVFTVTRAAIGGALVGFGLAEFVRRMINSVKTTKAAKAAEAA